MTKIKTVILGLLAAAACALGATALTVSTASATRPHVDTTTAQKAAAAAITPQQANAMQAKVVSLGEANSALSNPYIEQKVTTPESTGLNLTRIPAGGF